MKIVMAPMEGLADEIMRAVLTQVVDVDWCVTEFIRVTDTLLPPRAFYRISPELLAGAKTEAGTTVRLQLLGAEPACMADNAARAAELGAPVIDLNFGCPAPTVNRHRGGAILLREPELLYRIVGAVRRAVPDGVPVTAKMRLGYEDKLRAVECAQALEAAGSAELVVHARTKEEGYRPPAHWAWIGLIRDQVRLPLIANGEIWSVDDYRRCRSESGVDDVMLGRGLIGRPDLAAQIRTADSGAVFEEVDWRRVKALLLAYTLRVEAKLQPKHAPGRVKLWLRYLLQGYEEAATLLAAVRAEKDLAAIKQLLAD